MPGVVVTTAVRSGPAGDGDVEAAQWFAAGESERGPIDGPVLVRSFSEYTTYYGGYVAGNLYPHVKTFFEEGGARAYILRTVGAGASAGLLTLQDSDSDVLTITATSPGAWSANVTVEVATPDALSGGFRLIFTLDGETVLATRDLADVDDAVGVVNNSAIAHLMEAENVGTGSDANPVTLAATALSAGSNGAAISYANGAAVASALEPFAREYGTGAVSMPGQEGSAIWEGLRDHARDYNRIAYLGFGSETAINTVKGSAAGYYGDADAKSMAFFYPAVLIPSPATYGTNLVLSPESYAAGARAKAITQNGGPWRPGAGLVSEASSIVGLATDAAGISIDTATGNLLDEARINAIRRINNSYWVYGARSVSNDEQNWKYHTLQDTINYIAVEAEERLEDYLFDVIDSRNALYTRIESALVALLDPIRVAGGLWEAFDENGEQVDPGYSVVVSDANNPVSQVQQGIVQADIGVRVSSVGDQIQVTITKSNLTSSVV